MTEVAMIVLGAGQVGLLTAIFFRLGGLTATVAEHARRIDKLEKETHCELVA